MSASEPGSSTAARPDEPVTTSVLRHAARFGGRVSRRLDRAVSARTAPAGGSADPGTGADLGAGLDDATFVTGLFQELLYRDPDDGGLAHFTGLLASGTSRDEVRAGIAASPEHEMATVGRAAIEAFHGGRVQWVKSLPPARRILDLGGTSLGSSLGSLIVMGYPYDFDDLAIVELPAEDRHALYLDEQSAGVDSDQGPVRYLWRSMVDLGDLPDGSIDMVVSAQTFEHITEAEGAEVLAHVRRLLAPGGVLALDTPNRALTAIECARSGAQWINPDHKIEYTHEQMLAAFAAADLRVDLAFGIGLMAETARTGQWQAEELMANPGLYADITRCYTLAYLARAGGGNGGNG